MTKGSTIITIQYTADGEKLSKTVTGASARNYVAGIEYLGSTVEAIYHSEGRLTWNSTTSLFEYEYALKDHLGNARVFFKANGSTATPLQENHYYPFGMEMEGSWITQSGPENEHQYNGKELNEDAGLNWYDYGARWYDAAVGRWWSVDPMAESSQSTSSFSYVINNPLLLVDPNGMVWVNAYYEQLLNEVSKSPDKINLSKVEKLAKLGNETQEILDNLSASNPELYNYIDNLTVSQESFDSDGNLVNLDKNVVVRVALSNQEVGNNGQYAETQFRFASGPSTTYKGKNIAIPIPQVDPNIHIAGQSIISEFNGKNKMGEIGFNILIFRKGRQDNETALKSLANEAGDVMFPLEYNTSAVFDAQRKAPYNELVSTNYSFAVEKAHDMIQKGVLPKSGVYPIILGKKTFSTQNGTAISKY